MKRILPVIVIAQFLCTSLWFAGNAIMGDIAAKFHLDASYLAYLASVVQLGFITGTLTFAILSVADRFSPVRVFFCCAIAGALINLGVALDIRLSLLLLFRFLTGFFLAGIYPVGMKIAADHYEKGLGKSLGFLVGALVIGTSFPHLLKSLTTGFSYKNVIYATSALAAVGGVAMVTLVPDGPYRKPAQQLRLSAFKAGFQNGDFRSAAFGYFGHMWEQYAFWVFVPVMLAAFNKHTGAALNVPLWSFIIIVSGSLSCIAGGYVAQLIGPKKVAAFALAISGLCCLLSPVAWYAASPTFFVVYLLVWGMAVIADSPMFSTLVAQHAPVESKGAALTIVNCIGFSITIISIQLLNLIQHKMNDRFIYMLLAAGPAIGLYALLKNRQQA